MCSKSDDYLSITFLNAANLNNPAKIDDAHWFQGSNVLLPLAKSRMYETVITKAKRLTKGEDVKVVYDAALDVENIDEDFQPGDTIGILPRNDCKEIEEIFSNLNLSSLANEPYSLSLLENTTKKKPAIPAHIPSCGTLQELFSKCLDVRSIPKKMLLRTLRRYTTNPSEVEKLDHLFSPKGSQEYNNFVENNYSGLLSLLRAFPSCRPPVERLLEHLPALRPRPYSISSSPLIRNERKRKELHISYVVVVKENEITKVTKNGVVGVCSGWLEKNSLNSLVNSENQNVTGDSKNAKNFHSSGISEHSKNQGSPKKAGNLIGPSEKIFFYFRQPNNFRLPQDLSIPIIMISHGTGLAPFFGFLQHRHLLRQQVDDHGSQNNFTLKQFGTSWLFYGCRYSNRDFLYEDEITEYLDNGTLTRLFTCFSREGEVKGDAKYVSDLIGSNGKDFVDMIAAANAIIYVCGDARNMMKDVRNAIVSCVVKYKGKTIFDAEDYVKGLERDSRYIQDAWL